MISDGHKSPPGGHQPLFHATCHRSREVCGQLLIGYTSLLIGWMSDRISLYFILLSPANTKHLLAAATILSRFGWINTLIKPFCPQHSLTAVTWQQTWIEWVLALIVKYSKIPIEIMFHFNLIWGEKTSLGHGVFSVYEVFTCPSILIIIVVFQTCCIIKTQVTLKGGVTKKCAASRSDQSF